MDGSSMSRIAAAISISTPSASWQASCARTPASSHQGASDMHCSGTGDALTVLSNAWTDGDSFVYPFAFASRPAAETTQRFAMMAGDTITSLSATPNEGGNDLKMNGGVHNFIR